MTFIVKLTPHFEFYYNSLKTSNAGKPTMMNASKRSTVKYVRWIKAVLKWCSSIIESDCFWGHCIILLFRYWKRCLGLSTAHIIYYLVFLFFMLQWAKQTPFRNSWGNILTPIYFLQTLVVYTTDQGCCRYVALRNIFKIQWKVYIPEKHNGNDFVVGGNQLYQ